jgi:hypothetical protein
MVLTYVLLVIQGSGQVIKLSLNSFPGGCMAKKSFFLNGTRNSIKHFKKWDKSSAE